MTNRIRFALVTLAALALTASSGCASSSVAPQRHAGLSPATYAGAARSETKNETLVVHGEPQVPVAPAAEVQPISYRPNAVVYPKRITFTRYSMR